MIILKRFIIEKLKEWKESKYRKPLILKGARQVGKTYILKNLEKKITRELHISILTMTKICIIYLRIQKIQKEY